MVLEIRQQIIYKGGNKMSKITKSTSGSSYSYKVVIPKELAEMHIEKYGNKVKIKVDEKGFKLIAITESEGE